MDEPKTIESLCIVYDHINMYTKVSEVPISRLLLGKVRTARKRYLDWLENEKKQKFG